MMRRYNRLLVLFYVICDALLGMAAFALAYVVRFRILDVIIPITKGIPPFSQYLTMMPFIGLIVPIAFQVQGTYGLREIVREVFERRWKAGIGLKRVLIAGASDLGRMVADKVLEHREFGFKI